MKYVICRTKQFKKDVKRLEHSGKDVGKLLLVINTLAKGEQLSKNYHAHQLKGFFRNKIDCHIEDDWLLIYAIEDNQLVLYRTGTHSQLFR